jgi:hypothetical protein
MEWTRSKYALANAMLGNFPTSKCVVLSFFSSSNIPFVIKTFQSENENDRHVAGTKIATCGDVCQIYL